jgi:hypothetical protein
MPMSKYCLQGGWYPPGFLVNQQSCHSNESNKNAKRYVNSKHQYMLLKCGDKVVKGAHASKHVHNFTTDMLLKIMDPVPISIQQLADF